MFFARNNKNQIFTNRRSFIKGFTLLELLIVIVIMVLVFSVGMANFRDYQRRKNLDGAVLRVKSHLRLAQEMAISGAKPEACVSSNLNLDRVIFQIDSTTTYSIRAQCSDGIYYPYPNSAFGLEPDYIGIEISGGPVVFNTLGRGVVSNITLIITQVSTGTTKSIAITKGGEID